MKIIIPKHSGFCYGVKRAVDVAYGLAAASVGEGGAYMYGDVVHNPAVVSDLQKKGLTVIYDLNEIPVGDSNAKILIRAHGVPAAVFEEIEKRGFTVIDMTCPHVQKIHAIVIDASARGLDIIICGAPKHPEIEGILSRITGRALLVQSIKEAREKIPSMQFSPKGVCLVAQTTFNLQTYNEIRAFLAEGCAGLFSLEAHDTICHATAHCQNELRELAKTADACIVVGGKNSSNVTKLYEIACEYCSCVQHIECAEQLDRDVLKEAKTVVIAGGASTPAAVIQKVKETLT